jgi:hypothetical protein
MAAVMLLISDAERAAVEPLLRAAKAWRNAAGLPAQAYEHTTSVLAEARLAEYNLRAAIRDAEALLGEE